LIYDTVTPGMDLGRIKGLAMSYNTPGVCEASEGGMPKLTGMINKITDRERGRAL